MDPLQIMLIIVGIYLIIYFVAQAIGIDKLSEKGLDVGVPFFVMWRTERLNAFLTRMGKKFPRAFFNLGIVVAFGGMIFGFWMFGDNLLKFFIQPEAAGGVVPIIPGITISGLPLVYMLIGIAVTLITHEFAHGLASAKDDIPIKSSGLLFLLVLFGGFVEPDEEVFENEATPQSRMRLLAAGSFVNLIGGFIVFILIANINPMLSVAFNQPNGAYIYDIEADSPAAAALEVGDVIVQLNNTEIDYWYNISVFMADAEAGDLLEIHLLGQETPVTIHLMENPSNSSKGYIGIFGADYWEPKPGWEWIPGGPLYAFHIQQVLTWCFIILFSLALFNLLPIPVFDGDKLLSNGLSLYIKDERTIKMIMWPIRIVAIVIVVLSIVLTFLTGKALF